MRRLVAVLAVTLAAAVAVAMLADAALLGGPANAGASEFTAADLETGTAPAKLVSGEYGVKVTYRRSAQGHESVWELTVSGSRIRGKSFWKCCPGARTDPLTGKISGNRVVIVRDCRGQGIKGPCRQTYVLTATSWYLRGGDRKIAALEGTYKGTASGASPVVHDEETVLRP